MGYVVFAHVLDHQNLIWAQQDHPPGDETDPTSGWTPGEYIVDHYNLAIKPDAPPGDYQVEIGMYDPRSGVRLPVLDRTSAVSGDRVVLTTIQLH